MWYIFSEIDTLSLLNVKQRISFGNILTRAFCPDLTLTRFFQTVKSLAHVLLNAGYIFKAAIL